MKSSESDVSFPSDKINSILCKSNIYEPPSPETCQNLSSSLCLCRDTLRSHDASDWLREIRRLNNERRLLTRLREGAILSSLLCFSLITQKLQKKLYTSWLTPKVTAIEACRAIGVLWNDSIILELESSRDFSQSTIVFNIIVAETYKWRTLCIIVSWSKWNYYGVFGTALQGFFCFPALFQPHWFPTGLN